MRIFNYSIIKEHKWDSELLGLVASIYKEAGKQDFYLKMRPEELEKLVEIAKIQSTESSNAIEGIVTTNTRIKQLVAEKTTPRTRDEQEIAGYRDALNIIHENFDAIPISKNYILQLHKMLYSHVNNPMAGSYSATKDAMEGISKILLKEVKSDHIGVCNVYPGGTDTNFRANANPDYLRPETIAKMIKACIENEEGCVHDIVIRPFIEDNMA